MAGLVCVATDPTSFAERVPRVTQTEGGSDATDEQVQSKHDSARRNDERDPSGSRDGREPEPGTAPEVVSGSEVERHPASGLDPGGSSDEGVDGDTGTIYPGQQALFRKTEVQYLRSGPLPAFEELQGYENVLPGLADRIMKMAEDASAAHNKALTVPIEAEASALKLATFAVAFLPWLFGVITVILLVAGQEAAAAISAVGTALSAGPQIIAATRRPSKSE